MFRRVNGMHPVILIAFFVSGAASLILETIWTRQLTLVFGATTLAISTVLTCFMGGLALGAYLFGRIADRLKQPILLYALLEGSVGLWALGIPWVMENVYPRVNAWLWTTYDTDYFSFSFIRFLAVALVILPPTTLLGGTLPLLSRHLVRRKAEAALTGRLVGALYTLNTAGAVAGAFLATFVLLPGMGIRWTNGVAAMADMLIAGMILGFRRRLTLRESAQAQVEAASPEAAGMMAPVWRTGRMLRWAALAAFFLSGFAAMNFQVILNRIMALVLGSSVYSFGIVLLAFLLGIALGSAWASALAPRIESPLRALALTQMGAAISIVVLYLCVDNLSLWFGRLILAWVPDYGQHVPSVKFCMFSLTLLVSLPTTLFLGATFPFTIRAVAGDTERVGEDVGNIYAVNTIGAILGSFVSAFMLLPFLSRVGGGRGMELSLFVSLACHASAAIFVFLAASSGEIRGKVWASAVGIGLVVFMLQAPLWDQYRLTLGLFRFAYLDRLLNQDPSNRSEILFYEDGVTTTVSVERSGDYLFLKNNGKTEASTYTDMRTQILLGVFPLALHPRAGNPLDVMVLGFGSGVSIGSALQFPVRKLDAVEYEPAVVMASRQFGRFEGERPGLAPGANRLIYRAPIDPRTGKPNIRFNRNDLDTYVVEDRLRIINNDGRNYLASTPERYDVIVAEPSNPWITGVSNLFTLDHFVKAKQALRTDGIFCQWVQLYELSPERVKVIFRTFAEAFPHVMVFSAEKNGIDTILLGSQQPIVIDLNRLERLFRISSVQVEMERAGLSAPTDVPARLIFHSRKEVLAYTDGASLNTDDNMTVEFTAPDDLIRERFFKGYCLRFYRENWPYGRLTEESVRGIDEAGKGGVRSLELGISLLTMGRLDEARRFLALSLSRGMRPDLRAVRVLSILLEDREDPLPMIREILASAGGKGADAENQPGSCAEAVTALTSVLDRNPGITAMHPEILRYLGLCHLRLGDAMKAVDRINDYLARSSQGEGGEPLK